MLCAVKFGCNPLLTPTHIQTNDPPVRPPQFDLGFWFRQSARNQTQSQASFLHRLSARIRQCQDPLQLSEAPYTPMAFSDSHDRLDGAESKQHVDEFDGSVQADTASDVEHGPGWRSHRYPTKSHQLSWQQSVVMDDDATRRIMPLAH